MLRPSASTGEKPGLDQLWFGAGPDAAALRLAAFLTIFDCPEYSELRGSVEDRLLAALCLLTYLFLQVTLKKTHLFASLGRSGRTGGRRGGATPRQCCEMKQ